MITAEEQRNWGAEVQALLRSSVPPPLCIISLLPLGRLAQYQPECLSGFQLLD
jgi:hypothetical protein